MARIDLIESGLIYTTDLSIDDGSFVLSPNKKDCFVFSSGGLFMNPAANGGRAILALCSSIKQPYVCEVQVQYSPAGADDGAGLTLWASPDDALYLSVITGGDPYERLRIKAVNDRCEAYGCSSAKGYWEIIGTAFVSPDMTLGLYAEGTSTAIVSRFSLTKDDRIYIGNAPAGATAIVYDSAGQPICLAGVINGTAVLPAQTALIFDGTIELRDAGGILLASTGLTTIAGGNIYWYNMLNLNVYLDGNLLDYSLETSLGPLEGGFIKKKLEIENPSDTAISGLVVRGIMYHGYHGYEWVRFAPDVDGTPGEYAESVTIDVLEPYGVKTFWLKIERPADLPYVPITEHKFGLLISEV